MISQKAIDLIIQSEGCDLSPNWPGGESGVTYGYGYDLGYNSKETIKKDWAGLVSKEVLDFMISVAGLKGQAAKAKVTDLTKRYRISNPAAQAVLRSVSIPKFTALALRTYPGLDKLNPDTIGAIVSLVFNRGASFGTEGKPSWESRREMRELAPLIASGDYARIAEKIANMKRLWEGKQMGGLIARRENEANLINESIA